MEMGSFIELQFPDSGEYYSQDKDIARLNTGRAAIWHATRVLACNTIWIPVYQCDTVRDFLLKKGMFVKYYNIDEKFNPIDIIQEKKQAVLLVNYYGVMSKKRMEALSKRYMNAIIDNSQAFFSEPINECMNVYSCRKFIGVPDGAYVIGKNAESHVKEYDKGFSSDTALFMLQRIEYGCEGKAYQSRILNEGRIDAEDCMQMSKLTQTILAGINYDDIKRKRRKNFEIVSSSLNNVNCINATRYYDCDSIPMVYPLVIEDDNLLEKMQKIKHFQGHWWSYLLNEIPVDCFEYWLSRYIIPITIDQRYKECEITELLEKIMLLLYEEKE